MEALEAFDHAMRRESAKAAEAVTRVPVRKLALVTAITCVVAQTLSLLGGRPLGHGGGPAGVVVGQAIWNGAQVGLLVLLLCLWFSDRRWWFVVLSIAAVASLPFAHYALSPGGWAFTALLFATCALAWACDVPDIGVAIGDAPARGTPMLAKFEFLAFVCNLLSSMYNYNLSRRLWPYWGSIYAAVAGLVGFAPNLTTMTDAMYTLGLDGVSMPTYIKTGSATNSLGALIFLLIWSVLPFLYVMYFAAMWKLAKNSPGTRIQQGLCIFGIFHFLFLTDFVDYRFGRGIVNGAQHWCHWLELFAWIVAILLPLYQKLTTNHWRHGNGTIGVMLHYVIAVWAAAFFIYQFLIYFAFVTVYHRVRTDPVRPIEIFGITYRHELGYTGALVLMVFLYGYMAATMRCKRISAQRWRDSS